MPANMSPETVQKVWTAAEKALSSLDNGETTRITGKALVADVATQTGLPLTVVNAALQMYVRNRADLEIQRGRNGGIRKKGVQVASRVAVCDLDVCGDCGQILG